MQKKIHFTNFHLELTQAHPTNPTPTQLPPSHVIIKQQQQQIKIKLKDENSQKKNEIKDTKEDTEEEKNEIMWVEGAVIEMGFIRGEDGEIQGRRDIGVGQLKKRGGIKLKILAEDKKEFGVISFRYQIRQQSKIQPELETIPQVSSVTLFNLKCKFLKDIEFIFKKQPILAITTTTPTTSTPTKTILDPQQPQPPNKRQLTWNQQYKIELGNDVNVNQGMRKNQKILFELLDRKDGQARISWGWMEEGEFWELGGLKVMYLFDKCYQPLGELQFEYRLENAEGKPIPQKKAKKLTQLTQITITNFSFPNPQNLQNLYTKICFGAGTIRTPIPNPSSTSTSLSLLPLNQNFYTPNNFSNLTFCLFQQSLIKDTFLFAGELSVREMVDGENRVRLVDGDGGKQVEAVVGVKRTQVGYRRLEMYDVEVLVHISTDIIGDSDMYVVAQLDGCTCQTQVITGKTAKFTQMLSILFPNPSPTSPSLKLTLMDQDIFKDDTMYITQIKLTEFKQKGEMKIKLQETDEDKCGWIFFRYRVVVGEEEELGGGRSGCGYGVCGVGGWGEDEDEGDLEFQVLVENGVGKDGNCTKTDPVLPQKKPETQRSKKSQRSGKQKLVSPREPVKPTQKSAQKTPRETPTQKPLENPKSQQKDETPPPALVENSEPQQPIQETNSGLQPPETQRTTNPPLQQQEHPNVNPNPDPNHDPNPNPNPDPNPNPPITHNKPPPHPPKPPKLNLTALNPLPPPLHSRTTPQSPLPHPHPHPHPHSRTKTKIILKPLKPILNETHSGYSIPKEKRFKDVKYSGEPVYYVGFGFDGDKGGGKKGVGFGYGQKGMFGVGEVRRMRDNPAPGSYDCDSDQKYKYRGPTFGLPWSYYQKVRLPEQGPVPKKVVKRAAVKLYPKVRNLRV